MGGSTKLTGGAAGHVLDFAERQVIAGRIRRLQLRRQTGQHLLPDNAVIKRQPQAQHHQSRNGAPHGRAHGKVKRQRVQVANAAQRAGQRKGAAKPQVVSAGHHHYQQQQQVSGLHVVLRSDLLKQDHRSNLGGTNTLCQGRKSPVANTTGPKASMLLLFLSYSSLPVMDFRLRACLAMDLRRSSPSGIRPFSPR